MTDLKETVSTCAENIKNRRSIRSYDGKPVSKEQTRQLIELAGMAPSVMNTQPWRFSVFRGDKREAVLSALRKSSIYLEEALALLNEEEKEGLSSEQNVTAEKALDFFNSLGNAPTIILITMRKMENDLLRRQALVSCGAAIENFMLAAQSQGMGTCCIGYGVWVEKEILQNINMPDSSLVAIISLGYPKDVPEAPKRRIQDINWVGP